MMANNNNRTNKLVVPGADQALEKMKLEIATELGIPDYDKVDKGDLPARLHGAIGGSMTKRLIELGQQALANQSNIDINNQSNLNYQEYKQEMIQDLSSGNNVSAEDSQALQ